QPATARGAKRIFQILGRPDDDQLALRRGRYDLVARSKFGTGCSRDSSDYFEIQSRRSGRGGARPVEVTAGRESKSGLILDSGENRSVGQDHRGVSRLAR